MHLVKPEIDPFNAFHKAEKNFFSLISKSQNVYEHLIVFASGVQAAGLNPAFVVRQADTSFSQSLVSCQSFYTHKKIPWTLIIPEYLYDETFDGLLQKQQFALADTGIAMAIPLQSIELPLNTHLTIKAMDADLSTWSIPLIYGFESTPEVTAVYTRRHQLASLKDTKPYHFSGFINDTVVCSLSVSLFENTARIDDVATMPAHQRMGYATELINATLQYLKNLKIKTCFLEASSAGFNIYKRIGFIELFKNYYYEIKK